MAPPYVTKLLPEPVANLTTYNLRTQSNLRPPLIKLKSYKTSFVPLGTSLWNKLPLTTRESPSLNIFKKIISPKQLPSNYNRLCSGYYGRLLTRLRLGLSGLNTHRFKYNLHNSPICSLCHLAPEDTHHYFISCPTHGIARQHLFNLLSSELGLDTNNHTQLLNTILYGNLNHNLQPTLLKFIYQFFHLTGRFQQH